MGGAGTGGGDGQWGGADWEGEMGRGRRAGKGQLWGGEHRGVGGEGKTRRVRLGGGNREGEMGKGAMGRGDGEGLKGRGRGEIGGGEEGVRGEGISQTDMMKCLGGRRLQSFLTLFTRATPGTSASFTE